MSDAYVDLMDRSCLKENPVDCIYETDLTPDQRPANDRQNELFAPLGKLGGARKYGKLGTDHPDIAALPPRN